MKYPLQTLSSTEDSDNKLTWKKAQDDSESRWIGRVHSVRWDRVYVVVLQAIPYSLVQSGEREKLKIVVLAVGARLRCRAVCGICA